jgi:hypothetical protein
MFRRSQNFVAVRVIDSFPSHRRSARGPCSGVRMISSLNSSEGCVAENLVFGVIGPIRRVLVREPPPISS